MAPEKVFLEPVRIILEFALAERIETKLSKTIELEVA